MTHLTVTEIMKATGKSQSTILRFIRELKQTTPEAVQVEEIGKTRQYKISKDEVQKHFVISEETTKEQQTPPAHQSTPLIPEGYTLIPTHTLQGMEDTIKNLIETNHLQSGAIANMKLLGTGKPQKKKTEDSEPVTITAKNTPNTAEEVQNTQVQPKAHRTAGKGKKVARNIEKNKPSKNKGFFQKLFGL